MLVTNGTNGSYNKASYVYGEALLIKVNSFIVLWNATLEISSLVTLDIAAGDHLVIKGHYLMCHTLFVFKESIVDEEATLIIRGYLGALDGNGNLTVYGSLRFISGNILRFVYSLSCFILFELW